MEKTNNIATPNDCYYEFVPGYLEKKCIEKLHEVVSQYKNVMESDRDLRELSKLIESINTKFNGGEYDAC